MCTVHSPALRDPQNPCAGWDTSWQRVAALGILRQGTGRESFLEEEASVFPQALGRHFKWEFESSRVHSFLGIESFVKGWQKSE